MARTELLLVPAQNGWEVPAWLRYGGWNGWPPPYLHFAILLYWNEQYGADLVGMNGTSLELTVARPPQTREEAETLAGHIQSYCSAYGEHYTLRQLAAILMESKAWSFWWD